MSTDTEAFLALFQGRHTFQTFDDKKQRRDLTDVFQQHDPETFTRINKAGGGIFLMINEGDGQGRTNDNVTHVRAYFADFDNPNQPLPSPWPLEPTALIESSPGKHHAYWLLTNPTPTTNETFNAQQVAIAHAVGSAANDAKGLSRVMRLPGYTHNKTTTPFTTRIINIHPDRKYTPEQIAQAFPPAPEPTAAPAPARAPANIDHANPTWTPDEIYATFMQNADLNEGRNNLGFNLACQLRDNNHPETEATRILKQFHAEHHHLGEHEYTLEEALDSVHQAYTRTPREPWAPKRSIKPNITLTENTSTNTENPPAAPPPPAPNIYAEHGCYYTDKKTKDDWEQIQLTNWTWEPQLSLTYADNSHGERGNLRINNQTTYEINIPADAWNSRRELLDQIGKYGAVIFTSSNTHIAQIRQAITLKYTNLPNATGVQTYGLHTREDEHVLVYENTVISNHEHPPVFYSGTPVDPGSPAHAAPPTASETDLERARQAITQIPNLITTETALAMLGYAAASPFAPRITPHLGHRIPFLYLAGERESGKTSAAQLALELATGTDNARLHKAPGMSPYQYDIAYSNMNNQLALLDEYRPGAIDDAQLRKHHDLGTKWRGSGIAAKDHAYNLNAPLIVLGEGFTEDAATLSRGILYTINKRDRGHPDTYNHTRNQPLHAYAQHLHNQARTLSNEAHQERLNQATSLTNLAAGHNPDGTPKRINPRLKYALTYIAYGLITLQHDTKHEHFSNTNILQALQAGITETLDGGEEGMTNLERFLECLGTAAIEHRNAAHLIAAATGPNEIIIRISPSVDAVVHRFKQDAPISNNRLLRKYAADVPWCNVDSPVHKDVRGAPIRGIRVNLAEVPGRCDISALEDLNELLRR